MDRKLRWCVNGIEVGSLHLAVLCLGRLGPRHRSSVINVERRAPDHAVIESIPYVFDTVEARWRPQHELRGRVVADRS